MSERVLERPRDVEGFLRDGAARMKLEAGKIVLARECDGARAACGADVLKACVSAGRIERQGDRIAARADTPAAVAPEPERRIECPLDLLRARKDKAGRPLLSKEQWLAGDRLRTDFTRAHMMPGIGMRWSAEPAVRAGAPSGGFDLTDAALAARARVERALDAVGPELAGLLIDVCCFLKGIEQVESERSLPPRSAKVLLGIGLSMLARHYDPPRRPATTRHWGAAGYRPDIRPSGA